MLVMTHPTVHLKWVNFMTCQLWLNKPDYIYTHAHTHIHAGTICTYIFIRTYTNKSKKIHIVLLRKIADGERRQMGMEKGSKREGREKGDQEEKEGVGNRGDGVNQ